MPVIITQSTQTYTIERQIYNLNIMTPPGQDPYITAVFGEVTKDGSGNIVAQNPQTSIITVTKNKLTGILPNNDLPSFGVLYNGLKNLFHNEWSGTYTGMK